MRKFLEAVCGLIVTLAQVLAFVMLLDIVGILHQEHRSWPRVHDLFDEAKKDQGSSVCFKMYGDIRGWYCTTYWGDDKPRGSDSTHSPEDDDLDALYKQLPDKAVHR